MMIYIHSFQLWFDLFSKLGIWRFEKEVPITDVEDTEFKEEGLTRRDLTVKYLVKKNNLWISGLTWKIVLLYWINWIFMEAFRPAYSLHILRWGTLPYGRYLLESSPINTNLFPIHQFIVKTYWKSDSIQSLE